MRKAPATESAGVIVGVMGSSSVLGCVVLAGKTKLLFVMGVAVRTAGSLDEVDEALSSKVGDSVLDAAALDFCKVVLVGEGAAVEAAAVGLPSCGGFEESPFEEGVGAGRSCGLVAGEGESWRGTIAFRLSTAWGACTSKRHKQIFESIHGRSILLGSASSATNTIEQCW